MLKKSLAVALVMGGSLGAYAQVDYSRCNSAVGLGVHIQADGSLAGNDFYELKSKKTEEGKVQYVFKQNLSGPGWGMSGPAKDLIIETEVDKEGRIIKLKTGDDKIDPKMVESLKKMQKEYLLNSTVMQADNPYMAGGMPGGFGLDYGGGGWGIDFQGFKGTLTREPTFYINDSGPGWGNARMVPLSKLTKQQREKIGLDESLLKSLKGRWKQDKKTVGKIDKSLDKIMAKSSPTIPLGRTTEFSVKDGTCFIEKDSQRIAGKYDGKEYSVKEIPTYSRERCEEIDKIFQKHKRGLNTCADVERTINADLFSNTKIYPRPEGFEEGGMVGGVGLPGGVGGGSFGVGSSIGGVGMGGGGVFPGPTIGGDLFQMKYHCDLYSGKHVLEKFGEDGGGWTGSGGGGSSKTVPVSNE